MNLLIDAWTAAVNGGKVMEAVDRHLASDYVWHVPGEDSRGREAVKGVFAKVLQDCPAFRITPLEVVSERDVVVVRWSIRCTQDGGESVSSISMDRVRDGQFVEGWEVVGAKGWAAAQAGK